MKSMRQLRQLKKAIAFCFAVLRSELAQAQSLHAGWAAVRAWLPHAVADFAIGWHAAAAKEQVYRREWSNLSEPPPLEDIAQWFRRAAYTGPSELGFAVKAKIIAAGQEHVWGPRRFRRAEVPQVQAELCCFVEDAATSGARLKLSLLPLALLAGIPSRPLTQEDES